MSFGKERYTIHFPSGEKCGNQSLYSSKVTCSWLLPSAFIFHNFIVPVRTELKYIHLPSGLYSDPSSIVIRLVSCVSFLVAISTDQISYCLFLKPVNNNFFPSGDQLCKKECPESSEVILVGLSEPESGKVKIVDVLFSPT